MKKFGILRVTLLVTLLLGAAQACATSYLVSNTSNTGAGSLRQAILSANGSTGADTINFAIPGAGVHTITLTAALPSLSDKVFINGYSQPGAIENSNQDDCNGVLLIHISGNNSIATGIHFITGSGESDVRGLIINGFTNASIQIDNGSTYNLVFGNYLGVNSTGTASVGPASGVQVFSSSNRIGGWLNSERNIIGGNASGPALLVSGVNARWNQTRNNFIGLAADGLSSLGGLQTGVRVEAGATDNLFGEVGCCWNRIVGCSGNGIEAIGATTIANDFMANTMWDNTGLPIDLAADGLTLNDFGDGDSGPNGRANFPVITEARTDEDGRVYVMMDVNGAPSADYRIDIYASPTSHPSGHGEGRFWIGSDWVSDDGTGTTTFHITAGRWNNIAPGHFITATATHDNIGTSEFSAAFPCVAGRLTVTNSSDVVNGDVTSVVDLIDNPGPDGISLREAIMAANNTTEAWTPDWIYFDILGPTPLTIAPTTPLPSITGQMGIAGYSQPGHSGSPVIHIDGSGAGPGANGLHFVDQYCYIYDLSITDFAADGIQIDGSSIQAVSCYIGVMPDGITPAGNGAYGVDYSNARYCTLGADWASPNVISDNTLGGIHLDNNSQYNTIIKTYIGSNSTATATLGTQPYGLLVENGSHDNTIGDPSSINVIVGHNLDGIHIQGLGSDDNTISGNHIGVDLAGTLPLANTQSGIRLNGVDNTEVSNSLISANRNGVYIDAGAENSLLLANKIGTNSAGTAPIPNTEAGLFVTDGSLGTIVGDGTTGGRNIISGNIGSGIVLDSNTSDAIVRGNYIGTAITGTASIPNASGISIFDSADNIIGGSSTGDANLLSGNDDHGLQILLSGAIDNVIRGNLIGTQADGISALGNGHSGIRIESAASGNTIQENTIAHNSTEGIGISADGGTGNRITQNSFFENAELAIDLSMDLVTTNDDGDSDLGPNDLLNFPVHENATLITNSLTITGHAPAGSEIEFYLADAGPSPSVHGYSESFGEGETYLFSAVEGSPDDTDGTIGIYTDDGTGPGVARTENRFSFTVDASTMGLDGTSRLTMLNIAPDGSTSEFSQVFQLNAPEICNDGLDNDGDGLIDCADGNCNGSADCPDNDNDGYTDTIDLDDDNDGILDADEHVVVMASYQPPCNPLAMDFTGPVTLVGGTDLLEGAVYKYSAVSAGIDAKVTIMKHLNQSAPTIDDDTTDPINFKPRSSFVLNGLGDQSYTEYLFEFVTGVGETPVIIPELFINFNDIDGGALYGEQNWVQLPTSYTEDDPTDLTTVLGDWVLGSSGTTEYDGASNVNPQANFSARYINASSLRIRVGVENRSAVTRTGTRAHSIEFACVSNFLNPTTYLMDFDEDGHPNFTDLDSDNDGIYDCIESLSGQAHSGGVLTGGVDSFGIPLSVSDGVGGVNYIYGDANSDSVLNAYSSDSDGDACNDVLEAGFPDLDGDGQLGGLVPPTVDADGKVTSGGL